MRFAVIPTHDRFEDFFDCLNAIAPQVDQVFMINHRSGYGIWTQRVTPIQYDEPLPNISEMWNLGLDAAHEMAAGKPYRVAVLNDDVVVPPDWFDRVEAEMQRTGAAAGCVQRPHDMRMAGYAFILDGSIRADPQFQWWYGDDDIQRRAGRVAFASGQDVEHRHPNSTTVGVLAKIAGDDEVRFRRKWRAS